MPRVNRALPRLQREARRKRVADALISGKNYRQIAQELDISLGTISADVRTVLKRWQADQVQAIDQWLLIQLRQLDALTAGIWPKAKSGDYAAIDRMLAIMDRRAKLLGLDAPGRLHVIAQQAETVTEPADLDLSPQQENALARLLAMPTDQLLALADSTDGVIDSPAIILENE